jgi:hypothetical protein
MQFISTPMHLLGLDLYNRPTMNTFTHRISFIGKEYTKTAMARIGRIFPAYGIGGIVNQRLRQHFLSPSPERHQ